jgi:hypothetical protein
VDLLLGFQLGDLEMVRKGQIFPTSGSFDTAGARAVIRQRLELATKNFLGLHYGFA